MVTYAMYLLQPNGTTPVIGSAVSITIKNTGEYADIGNSFPEFLYVITKGDEGHAPTKKAIQFPTIGRTILRSGWQASDYTQQTQTIFNYSSTTGASSQLDSLSLNIFSGGMPLIVSPGPTSATQDSSIKTYLQSTKSQNTVYVDGQDQSQGTSSSSTLISTPNYASQSASNTLNLHVTQERQVIQIGGGLDVVLDKLSSSDNKQHTFQQEFNFAPGMSYTHTGSTVIAQGSKAQQRIEITQLGSGVTTSDNHGINTLSTKGGICTENKLEILPCNQVVYTTKGTSSTYVTLIQIGKQDVNLTDQLKGSVLTITKDGKTYTINITDKTGTPIQATASDTKAPSLNETSIDNFSTPANWSVSGGTVTAGSDAYASGKSSLALTGSDAVMSKQVSLDLTNSDIVLRMKLSDITNLGNVSIVMHSGSGSAHLNLLNAYQSLTSSDPVGTGEDVAIDQQSNIGWSTISLAKGSARTEQGEWIIEGQGFSWSSINQIDLTIESSDGLAKQVEFGQLSTTPEQPNTTIGIVFDDGSSSILPAVDYMNQKNIQGSVAVIGKYVAQQTKGYLTLDQLKQLQSAKWSLVNHSYNHQDAISKYYDNNDLQGFTSDILEGAQLLEQDGIDTDPNWYIYPHGTTNPTVESIVGQYYKFARTEHRGPEGFPFGSPLAVKDFVVDDTTTVSAVERAIDDANTYHQILLLTFHRIHATATDKSGYDLGQFEQIVDYLSSTHSNALSLNEIDTANRVPINTLKITPGVGAELTSTVSVQHTSIFVLIGQFLKSIFFGGLTQNVHAASMDTSSIALSSNSTSTFPVSLFKADLSGNGGILTNEFSYWHPESGCAYTSSSLNVTSGTLFSTQGVGYSGIPTTESQSVCESQVKTNSATFTMTTKQSNFTDVKISLDYKIISHTNGGAAFTSYDGLHLLVGYQNQNALYATSLFRWDNETVIKKKIASSTIECSSPNSMDCYESLGLTTESAQLSSLNQWHHADITFLTDGTSVRIVEVIDGQQLLDVTDQGIISKSYPIGSVGIQANNTEFSFKNFDVNGN
jgi:peptidoglycan/xylan/chitin deacetylase (PgdA/CDA1 family)